MTDQGIDIEIQEMLDLAEELLVANGYDIVTEDRDIFPYSQPALAALKDGLLLVFSASVFRQSGQFLRPEELNHIREDLERWVGENTPESEPEVSEVHAVALVKTPDDVTIASPVHDIRWVTIKDVDELPDELGRAVLWPPA